MEQHNNAEEINASSPSPDRYRVLLVDDHPLFLKGVRRTLEATSEFEIIGEAYDGEEALRLAQENLPDLVMTDIELPKQSGLEVCQQLHRTNPHIPVIVFTGLEEDDLIFQAIKAGAAAYIVKGMEARDWVSLVRRVVRGEYMINEALLARPAVASKVLNQFRTLEDQYTAQRRRGGTDELRNNPIYSPLTGREIEILDWVSKGTSNKQIARQLAISDQTVKNHITSILRKLNANDRTQAVILAIQHGWVKLDGSEG
jgi:DNA-binding NarL/FixJ family response regulator